KYDSSGAALWVRSLPARGLGGGDAFTVTVDPSDNVIAAGVDDGTFVVTEWTPAGALRWTADLSGTVPGSAGQAAAVAADRNGNVFTVGDTNSNADGADFTVARFASADGHLDWSAVEHAGVSGAAN